jgi:hypothetical protein
VARLQVPPGLDHVAGFHNQAVGRHMRLMPDMRRQVLAERKRSAAWVVSQVHGQLAVNHQGV